MNTVYFSRRILFSGVFAVLFFALAYQTVHASSYLGNSLIGWLAANALVMSIAYSINFPWIFGKTEQGNLKWLPALFMSPFLIVIRVVWAFQNMLIRCPCYSEVAPDLFVGRICEFETLPDGVTLFIDLTAEFPTPRSIRTKLPRLCLPTLDACAPAWKECRQIFDSIEKHQGRIYVCCANGQGRSITFVAALLGRLGICRSAIEAVRLIQLSRPTAKPNQDQMSFLEQAFQSMNSDSADRWPEASAP